MLWKKDVLFCDLGPTCYAISLKKEILKRHVQNLMSQEKFGNTFTTEKLPCLVSQHSSHLIKHGKDIDPRLQENKADNIRLACSKMNGLILAPGESFSFWRLVGKISAKKGYKNGRVVIRDKDATRIGEGMGGGLCNLANTLHVLVIHSPLTVTEFHNHSDALAMEQGKRVPFSAGTSVCYNHIDYRFKNTTEQKVQLLLWCQGDNLYGELRSEKEFPWRYELVEEGHHFQKEGDNYYRVSKIYRNVIDRATENVLRKELLLDNHSKVMFDPALIPKELLWET